MTKINWFVSKPSRATLANRRSSVVLSRTACLAMRQTGNVMLVAPSEEIAAREKLELEPQKQIEELEPLYSEFIQVNYASSITRRSLKSGTLSMQHRWAGFRFAIRTLTPKSVD